MLKRHVFSLLFVAWMIFITFSSLASLKGFGHGSFNIPHADKLLHFIFYFVAFLLGMFLLREKTRGSILLAKAQFFVLVFCIFYGILMEIFQHFFTETRTADYLDALANSLGAIVALVLIKYIFSEQSRLKWKF